MHVYIIVHRDARTHTHINAYTKNTQSPEFTEALKRVRCHVSSLFLHVCPRVRYDLGLIVFRVTVFVFRLRFRGLSFGGSWLKVYGLRAYGLRAYGFRVLA